ncbi:conserved hypothetical protein [Trichormus variabilis ATCC 29413]|uniref:Uncharacterized protein n=3 Tax=Anabaena variabilis TaxID=264691 RepID=Q3MEU6_TRIV2|nr:MULTISPECIES: hypothetical protein [Nostocaceae]ABA20490.1 conserved hypothetical protein [Trichormus variabilis ATCC 29413]MBC1216173.1 hypothetical protein [Trichormus variabilis ARAD]MBC1268999.1 hypothetical protein [Trichormus variabilis FSR]MBC1304606.1 hypothetical protein [Trichormus variabilis N2B]MBC1313105.1 hypothetical protein [Trichormus variabilis PNB]
MLKLSSNIVLNLTIIGLFSSYIAIFTTPVIAGEAIIDRNCRYHRRTPQNIQKIPLQSRATIYFTSGFNANKQKYFLQVLKLPNSTGIFCLFNTNSQKTKKITETQMIQNKQIEKVEKLSDQAATYIVTVKGNKDENIFRAFYKLNLSNPYRPKITPIIKIYKS